MEPSHVSRNVWSSLGSRHILLSASIRDLYHAAVAVPYSTAFTHVRHNSAVADMLTHLLTPWCRTLFLKLIVTQLFKKYPTFLRNPKVHYHIHTSPPMNPILSQLNPVCPIDSYLPKARLNVILLPTPWSSQWSLTLGTPNQNLVNTSPLPHACHMSCPPHSPWFNHPDNIWWSEVHQ
jgi:hypothetical protein